MSVLQQSELSLKVTVVSLSSLCIALACLVLYRSYVEANFAAASIGALAILFGLGLYMMQAWARVACYAFCWLLLIIIIFGYLMNPFADQAAMGPQTWLVMLLNVLPYLVACIWVIHILGKYRSRFSNPLKRDVSHAAVPDESRYNAHG